MPKSQKRRRGCVHRYPKRRVSSFCLKVFDGSLLSHRAAVASCSIMRANRKQNLICRLDSITLWYCWRSIILGHVGVPHGLDPSNLVSKIFARVSDLAAWLDCNMSVMLYVVRYCVNVQSKPKEQVYNVVFRPLRTWDKSTFHDVGIYIYSCVHITGISCTATLLVDGNPGASEGVLLWEVSPRATYS